VATGISPDSQHSFVPITALAEYLELPESRNELRLTLANYELPCDRFVPAAGEQIHVSVVVVTPAGSRPAPGTYAWAGTQGQGDGANDPQPPFARPKALLGGRGHTFQPGGAVRLTKVALGRHAAVEGVLAFEFAGNAEHEATSLTGSFRARVCKSNLPRTP
jgi:hypothetical protein